ncbi:NAD(P)-binding protein [Acephala macrosclerotiorum]|nr:NAD(P)-binding protein [Acephala macrosclerotiorum]
MPKILAIFGATGVQGGSLINYVLNDPELSQKYKIRAITRDVNSEKAKQLKEKVEVVQGDVLNRSSLETALTGTHTIFAMTMPSFGPDGTGVEYNSGKNIADVAVGKGARYIIWSTLPPVEEISGGKFTKIHPFDVKAKVEKYIRGLDIKSAFYSPGSFMQNFQSQTFLAPRQAADGTWVMSRHNSPKSLIPLIDARGDTGKFVGAILAEPEKHEGKTLCAAEGFYTLEEVCAMLSKSAGKTIVYKQISVEEFRENLPFGTDPVSVDLTNIFVEGLSYYEEFGYWAPDSKELVAWAVENARGKLTTFEEFLEAHPFQLA